MVELLGFVLGSLWNFFGTLILMVSAAACVAAVVSRLPPIFAMNHFSGDNSK